MPVLMASTPMSSTTARNWAATKSRGTACTPATPRVFWAVSAVITVMAWPPRAATALISAWMPAPPPESDPAMMSTRGSFMHRPPP